MNRRNLATVATACLLVAALVTTGPAAATEETSDIAGSDDTVFQSEVEAEEADLANFARANGLSMAQARTRQTSVDKLGKFQAKILRAPGLAKVFAGARVDEGGEAIVYLKGRGNPRMTDAIEASGLDITVVKGRKYNTEQLQRRADAVHQRLADLGFGQMMTTFDVESGKVEAVVSTKGYKGRRQLPPQAPDAARAVRAMLGSELGDGVELEATTAGIGANFAAVGGMTGRNSGQFRCTLGWPVRQVEAPYWYGITTAGHCNINEAIEPAAGFGLTRLYFQKEQVGRWGDVEWHTADAYVRDDFIADEYNNVRDIGSVEPFDNLVLGESICVYGQSSDQRDCSRSVFRTSMTCTFSNGITIRNMVQMDGRSVATYGDSGGGWSWGNRVYGSTIGWCGFPGWDVVSVADFYDEAIGVRVIY